MLSLFWGFILTMWYVKEETQDLINEIKNSFILTMWYVKNNIYPMIDFLKIVLY